MKKMVILVCCVILSSFLTAQVPAIEWEQTWGGADSDNGSCVDQTSDGGFITFGVTTFNQQGSLVKFDSDGQFEWNQVFGGNSHIDYFTSGQQTIDGGYICAGTTFLNQSDRWEFWLVKTDSVGNVEWNQSYGGGDNDYCQAVHQTSDSGYIMFGKTDSYGAGNYDWWLVKTDVAGVIEWTQTFGTGNSEQGYDVKQTNDGGYIMTGSGIGPNNSVYNLGVIKTDPNGVLEWNSLFGTVEESDKGYSVIQTEDGGFAVAGENRSYGAGNRDVWLIKMDNDGNEEWNHTYGGNDTDSARELRQTPDGGFIILGYTESQGAGGYDMWLIKTDALGIEEWNQAYGGADNDMGRSVQITNDYGYILTGSTASSGAGGDDLWLIKLQSSSETPNPTNLVAVSENQEITLTWDEPLDFTPTSYNVYRDDTILSTTTEQTFIDTVEYVIQYTYFVTAVYNGNQDEESFPSNQVDVYVAYPQIFYPITNLEIDVHLGTLSWTEPADSVHNLTNYRIMLDEEMIGESTEINFMIENLSVEQEYTAEVIAVYETGESLPEAISFIFIGLSIENDSFVLTTKLGNCYPNPFNPKTTINYSVEEKGDIKIEVFNVKGQKIQTLVNGFKNAGNYIVIWNGTDSTNNYVGSGMYLYKMTTKNKTISKKMVLLK
ncbi:MAG: T9SS type A sorting domain-containing protein [Candidatus Cloacimonetes bacterium]|nr:T9SS type A sorting domain-containing protein [Candidatus Cloacimonadota bacterium]